MIQKESRLDVADNSGAKVTMVIGTKGMSTARGRFTRLSVGVGDRIVCTVKKALPNADIKAGDKVQAVIVRTKYPSRRSDGTYVRFDSNACVIVDPDGNEVPLGETGEIVGDALLVDNGDGTYDVDYDDGEQESRVAKDMIKRLAGAAIVSTPSSGAGGGGGGGTLRVGDKIDAKYRGRNKMYPATIARAHLDGTYDLDYDDGEKEYRIEKEMIEARGGGGDGDDRDAVFSIGDKVEANWKGRGRWMDATVERKHRDGSFDIMYDDGDTEKYVDKANLRKAERGSGRSSPRSPAKASRGGGGTVLRKGTKIEADYRGRGKYYKGVIARDHFDGTFDVDYDDGEQEIGRAHV